MSRWLGAFTIAVLLAAMCPVAAGADGFPLYVAPVDAPVVDPFRPPSTPYGSGNRGLEYGTAPGAQVRAAADGVVDFAGPVGTGLFVTIRHDDGIETTYSYLARLLVEAPLVVTRGEPIAEAGAGFHFGAKAGRHYVDPQILLDASEVVRRPILVPGPR